MKYTVAITTDGGSMVETGQLDDVVLVMMKPDGKGGLTVQHYEPLETDDHPDTLRQIGARVVDFAHGK